MAHPEGYKCVILRDHQYHYEYWLTRERADYGDEWATLRNPEGLSPWASNDKTRLDARVCEVMDCEEYGHGPLRVELVPLTSWTGPSYETD
jgi:hypothetical protein